jgi:hypothetical protein
MKRSLRPPTAIPVAPILISQVNCESACGLKPWRFLQLIVEHNLPHRRLGKLELVEAAVLLETLRAEKPRDCPQPSEAMTADTEADRVLRAIGRKRVA